MTAGSAPCRRALGAAALGFAALAGILAGCGLEPEKPRAADEQGKELTALAEKASRLSDLQQQAYQSNTLLKFSAAEQDYRETLTLARELFPTDPARASDLRLHLALNKSNLGQYETAENLFDRSRKIVEQLGPPSERAKPDLFYAQHQMNLKQFAKAEQIARQAETELTKLIAEVSKNPLAARLDDVGFVRRPDGALLIDQERANIANARIVRDTSASRSNSGPKEVKVQSGRTLSEKTNETSVGAGTDLTDKGRLQLQHVQALYIIARALRAQNKPEDEVESLVLRAEADLAEVPDAYGRWLRAEIASLRADWLHEHGQKDKAITELDKAVEMLRKYEVNSRPEALLLFKKGEYLIDAGRGKEGAAAYRKALDIIKNDTQGIEVEQARSVIDRLLEDVQAGNKDAEGQLFLLMQKVRSSATAQTVAQLSARLSAGDDTRARAIRDLQDLEREQNVLAARFDRLEADPNADIHYKRVTEGKLNDVRNDIAARKKQLGEIAPHYDQLIDAPIALKDAQAELADGEVMAVIQLGAEKGLVAVITNLGFDAYKIPLNVTSAEEAVRELRKPIDGEFLLAFDLDRAYGLYKTIFGPVMSKIEKATHLIVVPTGPLLSLPFNILVTEPYKDEIQIVGTNPASAYFDYSKVKWLGKQTGITTGVSISSFFLGRQTPRSDAPNAFIGFGAFQRFGEDPAAVARIADERGLPESCKTSIRALGTLNELPGTRDELRKAQAVLGAPDEDVVTGQAFTDTAIMSMDLSKFRVLHFATHGLLAQDPECLPEPGLVTSLSPTGDSLLEASEIVNLKLDAELVVMSACDTGAGAGKAVTEQIGFRGVGGSYAAGGESLNGLARSFFFAGARNVMSTHWSVDDRATQQLVSAFYKAAASSDDVSIAEALRKSETALIDGAELSHPFFWAPFAIIGDGARKLHLVEPDAAAEPVSAAAKAIAKGA